MPRRLEENDGMAPNIDKAANVALKVFLALVCCLVAIVGLFYTFENLDAGDVMVVQSPVSGTLTWHTDPGVKWQGFGTVTKYKIRDQFWFSQKTDQGTKVDESIKIRFNDGGHANVSGSIAWEIPKDDKNLTALHRKYGSHTAIQQQLVRTVIEKSVYMSGPLMSSKESYSERRNELLRLIEDQVMNGIYLTETIQEKVPDAMTGQMKTVNSVRLIMKGGVPSRSDESPLRELGIKTFNLSINEVKYDDTVEAQIQQQQKAMMQVQTAMAKAKEAEQEAITVSKKGEADAAKAKWEQEVIKAQAVTEAEQQYEVQTKNAERDLKVAELAAKAAEQSKREQILLGEGESQRRKMVMAADGALEKKLEAWVKVNENYATALEKYNGSFVPSVVMGGGDKGNSNAMDLVNLLMVKTARDLNLDIGKKAK